MLAGVATSLGTLHIAAHQVSMQVKAATNPEIFLACSSRCLTHAAPSFICRKAHLRHWCMSLLTASNVTPLAGG